MKQKLKKCVKTVRGGRDIMRSARDRSKSVVENRKSALGNNKYKQQVVISVKVKTTVFFVFCRPKRNDAKCNMQW